MDPLVLALVAIGGSIFGIWLGHQFQTRREDRRWRSDRKLEAYTSFAVGLGNYELMLLRRRAFGAGKIAPDVALQEFERTAADIASYNTGQTGVQLVGSAAAVDAVRKIADATYAHLGDLNTAVSGGTSIPGFLNIQDLAADFVQAARADLGFSPLARELIIPIPKAPEAVPPTTS